jgi:hypothetical protein
MTERRIWVLDTETKGTGATMVPLEQVERRERPAPDRLWVPPKPAAREPKAPAPRPPRRFRIVDVLSRRVLQEDGGVRETLQRLADVERPNDVSLSVWEPDEDRWRLLSLAEQRAVWDRRLT